MRVREMKSAALCRNLGRATRISRGRVVRAAGGIAGGGRLARRRGREGVHTEGRWVGLRLLRVWWGRLKGRGVGISGYRDAWEEGLSCVAYVVD